MRRTTKIDLRGGATESFDHGPGQVASEPIFVPDPKRAPAEDGGWLLAFVHDGRRRGTNVVVLDAQRVPDGPVATLRLPVNAGSTFHGCWVGRLT